MFNLDQKEDGIQLKVKTFMYGAGNIFWKFSPSLKVFNLISRSKEETEGKQAAVKVLRCHVGDLSLFTHHHRHFYIWKNIIIISPEVYTYLFFYLKISSKKSSFLWYCPIYCITLSHPDHHYDYHIGEYIGQLFNTTSSLSSLSWWHIRTPSFSDHFSNRCPFFQN